MSGLIGKILLGSRVTTSVEEHADKVGVVVHTDMVTAQVHFGLTDFSTVPYDTLTLVEDDLTIITQAAMMNRFDDLLESKEQEMIDRLNHILSEIEASRPDTRIIDWGDRGGTNVRVDDVAGALEKIKQISNMLVEESKETVEACDNRNYVKIVDGVADIYFVLIQAVESLRRIGIGIDSAIHAVCTNNDLKIKDSLEEAQQMLNELSKGQVTREMRYYIHEAKVTEEGMEKTYYSVHRLKDNKLMKAVDHPEVDLSIFIPDELKGE